ncbi:phenylacetate--CoA ligase family protein [Desulfovibrio ferrophilus]|uniref:Phenylacetate-coenzyme A ligase n=1 Tax=Desulfovibrio ferrophilus TaxID=241368 RepID=A0A2Z6AW66_9BACT|nr:AMP-binding protein [Desulfovibrio ferrophilus]BBD07435.1 phenylacetate-coenzyme A ligase [Desulfovibrio ferrophilus]
MTLAERMSGVYHDLETMSPGERAERTWNRLEQVIEVAWDNGGEFVTRLDGAGLTLSDIGSLADWARVPVLRKKELIEMQSHGPRMGGLLACELGDLRRIYQSPGPIFDPEGQGPDYWGWAEAFHAAGFRKRDVVQMTFSYHLTPAGLMLEEPLREIGCAVIPAGPGNTEKQLELLTELPVTGFVGMASYLRIIADKAVSKGLDLKRDFQLEVAFVAAERLSSSLRSGLEHDFGMLIRQGYGTADLGCIAYECPALGGMHVSNRCHVEICDPQTHEPLPMGETGEVVVTPFSTQYPLVRFATGDLSYFVDEPCDCGRTSLRLGAIVGRVDDTAKVKGQFIYPAQVAEVVALFEQIERWQVLVTNPRGQDRLELKLKLSGALDEDAFAQAFQAKCKLRPVLTVLGAGEDLAKEAPALLDKRLFE